MTAVVPSHLDAVLDTSLDTLLDTSLDTLLDTGFSKSKMSSVYSGWMLCSVMVGRAQWFSSQPFAIISAPLPYMCVRPFNTNTHAICVQRYKKNLIYANFFNE